MAQVGSSDMLYWTRRWERCRNGRISEWCFQNYWYTVCHECGQLLILYILWEERSWDNSVDVVTERPRNRGSIPGRDERYLFMTPTLVVQTHPASSSLDTEGRVKRPGREADLYLTPRFKNEWNYTSIPPYECSGIALPSPCERVILWVTCCLGYKQNILTREIKVRAVGTHTCRHFVMFFRVYGSNFVGVFICILPFQSVVSVQPALQFLFVTSRNLWTVNCNIKARTFCVRECDSATPAVSCITTLVQLYHENMWFAWL